jgi:hypothetical protein
MRLPLCRRSDVALLPVPFMCFRRLHIAGIIWSSFTPRIQSNIASGCSPPIDFVKWALL